MSYNCCYRNFSSCSLGGYLRYPGSSCGSSYPSGLVYSPDLCSPSTCQLGSSVYRGCQKTCCEPARCQTSHVVSSPCQVSCYRPRTTTLCSPSLSTYSGSLGCGSSRGYSLGCGSRSFCSMSCGTSGFKPLGYGVCCFPSLRCGSGF